MKWLFTIFSTGKPFDPAYQKRTGALEDIVKKDNKKLDNKIRRMFGLKEKK